MLGTNYWREEMLRFLEELKYIYIFWFIWQPSLKRYQEINQPDYIYRKNREAIEASKGTKISDEPEAKRPKRRVSLQPLERKSISPLPELPKDLRLKQVSGINRNVHAYSQFAVGKVLI